MSPSHLIRLCWRYCAKISVDRKSTRLNSSHGYISYAVFCLKKKKMPSRGALDHYTASQSISERIALAELQRSIRALYSLIGYTASASYRHIDKYHTRSLVFR